MNLSKQGSLNHGTHYAATNMRCKCEVCMEFKRKYHREYKANNKFRTGKVQMKTSQEIRQALIQIADRNNRPHYTLAVVRDVIHAIKNDLDHPLAAQVLTEKIEVVQIARPKTNLEVLREFCAVRGVSRILAKNVGISDRYMTALLGCERNLTDELFSRMKSCFDRTETESVNRAKTKKKNMHGTTNCYQNGCRCTECRAVYQERNQARLRQITAKYTRVAA